MVYFSLFALALASGALSQSTIYLDSNTGISFAGQVQSALTFGVAVPENPTSDFIGQIVAPIAGYGAVSLGGSMAGSLMVVAWPNGDSIVGSIRTSDPPTVYDNPATALASIANGTFVNSTHFTYTFLCSGCLADTVEPVHFDPAGSVVVIGWATSSTAVTNPSSPSAGGLAYHNTGFGLFGLALDDARSPEYPLWASWANAGSGGGNSTTPGNGTNPGNPACQGTNNTATVSEPTYDYIVAGGGAAGIIAAERLAESGKSVLLIERGQASNYASGGRSVVTWNNTVTQYDVPSMAYYLSTANDTSGYCTDVASQAGCILGGGTTVNALMFVHPQAADFDDKWPSGWKWNDVSAAADRLYERNPGTTLASKDGQRYDQGAFTVLSSFLSGIGYKQVDAIEQPNEKTKIFSHPPWSISNGLRAGPVVSYLPIAAALPNFSLSLNTKVVRVLRANSTVTGVEVETSTGARQIFNLNLGGSVVLASGALSTPRILFNSGIGPSAQISIVKNSCTGVTLPAENEWIDLPVGQNLRDHPIFTLTFRPKSANITSMLGPEFTSPTQTNIGLFSQASGPLVQSGQRLVFFSSIETESGTRFFQGTCNMPSAGTLRMRVYLTHGATSVGSLGITPIGTTEFLTSPLMNTPEDTAATVAFLDSLISASRNSTVLEPIDTSITGATAVTDYVPGSHFVGTAMMGTSNDGTAVVDTDTKVFGTDNLFVVDASIHPDLPTGNTQAIVMVVAEQAAARILALGSVVPPTNGTAPVGNSTLPGNGNSTGPGWNFRGPISQTSINLPTPAAHPVEEADECLS